MRSKMTEGAICVRDPETLVEYRVAFISYTAWENDEFCYEIEPNYAVTELLGPRCSEVSQVSISIFMSASM